MNNVGASHKFNALSLQESSTETILILYQKICKVQSEFDLSTISVLNGNMIHMDTIMEPKSPLVLKHSYSSDYRMHQSTGVACFLTPQTRLELSFYADRIIFQHEELEAIPDQPGQFKIKEEKGIASIQTREHVTGVNMSVNDAQALHDLLGRVLSDVSQGKVTT